MVILWLRGLNRDHIQNIYRLSVPQLDNLPQKCRYYRSCNGMSITDLRQSWQKLGSTKFTSNSKCRCPDLQCLLLYFTYRSKCNYQFLSTDFSTLIVRCVIILIDFCVNAKRQNLLKNQYLCTKFDQIVYFDIRNWSILKKLKNFRKLSIFPASQFSPKKWRFGKFRDKTPDWQTHFWTSDICFHKVLSFTLQEIECFTDFSSLDMNDLIYLCFSLKLQNPCIIIRS